MDWMQLGVSGTICRKNGQLDLGEMLERLKKDQWNAPVM